MSKEVVVVHFPRSGAPMCAHEKIVLAAVAQAIAKLKNCEFGGSYVGGYDYHGSLYFVPAETLITGEAIDLGICRLDQLFGGIVPYPFVKTKAITHQLVGTHADRPEGWSATIAQRVRNLVLPGYTAFSVSDARRAAARLLPQGAVRLKEPLWNGGFGQTVAATAGAVDAFLERYPAETIAAHGLVLEMDLRCVVTRSVGQITIGDQRIAYFGTQRTAINNDGRPVYGGSHLTCARGGWAALDGLSMPEAVRLAVAQARSYDQAASAYPGFLVTRRNYDVGQGVDEQGRWRSGVFEASWRSGGASTAELAAFCEFARDPALQVVGVSAEKEFGRMREAPPGALIHFQGEDPEDGPLLRYTMVERSPVWVLAAPFEAEPRLRT